MVSRKYEVRLNSYDYFYGACLYTNITAGVKNESTVCKLHANESSKSEQTVKLYNMQCGVRALLKNEVIVPATTAGGILALVLDINLPVQLASVQVG